MTESYFNERAQIWDEKIAEKDAGKLRNMAENLDIVAGSVVLDVGTGTGVFVPFLLEKIGSEGKLVCLDFAQRMLDKAIEKGYKGNISYVCSDIHRTDFNDDAFDAVVCYSSFPHFLNKPRALTEIRRILRKGGSLFICHTASRAAINTIHTQIAEVSSHVIPDDDEMLGLLSVAGLGKIRINDEPGSYLAKAEKL